ncbi:hypothetical protein [Caldisalinibacter kiritimatiensis]|uniref:hypothetical protein n=1 Tax=Caldisalinibacter kiritimatiensis TaxID=1304284 RepID=UPI00138AB772|nr:hypothetical protein [Caldisalinibacter kiritimatiensis]
MRKCKKCLWGTWLTPKKVYCMFPVCFKEKTAKEKSYAKKTKAHVQLPRLPRTDARKILRETSEGRDEEI